MALIPCPECKKEVSSFAKACPHCGYPVAERLSGEASPREEDAAADPLPDRRNLPAVIAEAKSAKGGRLLRVLPFFIAGFLALFALVKMQESGEEEARSAAALIESHRLEEAEKEGRKIRIVEAIRAEMGASAKYGPAVFHFLSFDQADIHLALVYDKGPLSKTEAEIDASVAALLMGREIERQGRYPAAILASVYYPDPESQDKKINPFGTARYHPETGAVEWIDGK